MNPVSKSQSYDDHLLLFQDLKEQLLAAQKSTIKELDVPYHGAFENNKPFDWSYYNFNIHEELMALLDVFGESEIGYRGVRLISINMPFQGQNNWTGDFAKDWGSHFVFGENCCWDPPSSFNDDEITDHIWFCADVDSCPYSMYPGQDAIFSLWDGKVGNNLYDWLLEFLHYQDIGLQLINRKTEGKD